MTLEDEQRLTKIYKAIDLQKQVIEIMKDPDIYKHVERLSEENPQLDCEITTLIQQMDELSEKL